MQARLAVAGQSHLEKGRIKGPSPPTGATAPTHLFARFDINIAKESRMALPQTLSDWQTHVSIVF
jgi:hypothetical protein